MSGRRHRRRLAKSIQQVRLVDGAVRAFRIAAGLVRRSADLPGSLPGEPRSIRLARVVGGTKRVSPSGGRQNATAAGGGVMTIGTATRSQAALEAFQRDRLPHVLPDFTRLS